MREPANVRVFVKICMTIAVIFLYFTYSNNLLIHKIFGVLIIPFAAIHLFLNRKWIKWVTGNFTVGNFNKKTRYMISVVIGLFISLVLTIFSGILRSIFQIENATPTKQLHSLSTKVFIVLLILHVMAHLNLTKMFDAINEIRAYIRHNAVQDRK